MSRKERPAVECAKCGHVNVPGKNHCAQCAARLYITCNKCGESNQRAASHCEECGHRLHRSLWSRFRRRAFGKNPKVTPLQLLALIGFVLIGYKLVVYFSEYRPPAGE